MSYAEDENYDGYDLEVDAENDSLQHALTDAIKKLAEAREQLRLCNVDQFTTAAELADAVAKERERCAREEIKNLEAALAEQKPMLEMNPQKREWVGLTDEERNAITEAVIGLNSLCGWEDNYAKAIEAKLREKNT